MSGIAAYSTLHAAGVDNHESWQAILTGRSGLRPNTLPWCDLPTWIGEVVAADATPLPAELHAWDCRTHRLAWLALQRNQFSTAVNSAVEHYGASRIGLVMGSSTAGIRSTEVAYKEWRGHAHWPENFEYRRTHSLDALSRFTAELLGLKGPMVTISTACSSSAKVFAMARRWIDCGLIDAAVVGGVDSLCLTTLLGFNALQLLSSEICRPFDSARTGISIGEAAGFALLDRQSSVVDLVGCGESSDAWHMSAPHPDGLGAQAAMLHALKAANLKPEDIGYVNAHGTATLANDLAEAAATRAVFGSGAVPISSTKGVTGHTLGAAGITDAIVVIQALEQQTMPPSANLRELDPRLGLDVVTHARDGELRYAMSNSFGFGGTNCSLIFSRTL